MAAPPISGVHTLGQDSPLTLWQIAIVSLCVFVNICDGLDTTSIAYAAPSLLRDWNIPAQTFGLVLSAGALGLMIGAIVIAPMADKVGRRAVILASVTTCAICMFGLAMSQNLPQLLVLRLIIGVAVGALVPSLSIMVVEFSNERRGNLFLSLVHIGFAAGAILGAAIGAALVETHGWRSIFFVAGLVTSIAALLCHLFMPESLTFLMTRQPVGALGRVNKLRLRFGESALSELPPRPPAKPRQRGIALSILTPLFLRATLLLWVASFARYFISYFLTGWKPQVLVLAGFTNQAAIAVGMATSAAAAVGVLLMGLFASVIGAARATAIAFVLCALALLGFAFTEDPIPLVLLAAACMFTIEAAFTGIVITTTRFYPAENRSTGVGYTMGVGRLGAIVGPYVGGALIGMNLDRTAYFPVYAAAAIIGAIAVMAAMARSRPPAEKPA
ncbi:MAG: MFS transporter [Terricaulis sp.]|nr:MFS transporter [Terricaulis sp.]